MKAAQRSTGRNKFADKIEGTCHLAWATGRCGITIKIQDIMTTENTAYRRRANQWRDVHGFAALHVFFTRQGSRPYQE
jgi:hypothetical protein